MEHPHSKTFNGSKYTGGSKMSIATKHKPIRQHNVIVEIVP